MFTALANAFTPILADGPYIYWGGGGLGLILVIVIGCGLASPVSVYRSASW